MIQSNYGKDRDFLQEKFNVKLAVAVLLEHNGSFLMIRRNRPPGIGLWALPGGAAKKNETAMVAACREMLEEIGIAIRILGLIGVYCDDNSQMTLIVYAASSPNEEFTINPEEVQAVEFFDPLNLPKLAFQRDKKVVSDWLMCKRFKAWG